ncbi:serine/threonine-protein kinase [Nonomuraea sp. SBT364]|uniref:serine/threonine-protein kinase n=1 Tax=Nonomuraea sp. SBT364 TaxID=1580530 RepID=UPI00069CDB17|nr:serine/threonine-protein kinase [Nonomuraea sp. SBT364]
MSGERVIGGYVLRRVLGRGGMGEVHLASTPTGGLAAVKLIHPALAGDPAFRRRFEREVAAARRVARFCTAPVLDAGIDGEVAYLVTEYVKGPDLTRAVQDQGPLSGGNLDALAVGIATALSAIHGAGVIHRDLKPSNVLLSPLGPKVIDFGIAQLVGSDSQASQAILGTPSYMAPEQARGEPLTPATDVYAWGGVIAFAGTGRAPFGSGAPGEVLYRIVSEEPRLDGLDEGIRDLVSRALAKDPRERPTVQRLLADLLGGAQVSAASATQVVERTWTTPGPPPAAMPPGAPAAPAPGVLGPGPGGAVASGPRARRRWLWAGGGIAAVAVLAVAAALLLRGPGAESWPYEADFGSWEVGASDGGNARQDGASYELTVKDGWRLWKSATRAEPAGGVVVSAKAALAEGRGEYGVWCRGTGGDRYEFAVSGSGKVAIVKRRAGREGVVLYGPERVKTGEANRVVAECAGDGDEVKLRMWLNETLVAEAADADGPYDAGAAGVHAAPDAGATVRVRFESFALRPAQG